MIFQDKHKLRQFLTNLPAQRSREVKTGLKQESKRKNKLQEKKR